MMDIYFRVRPDARVVTGEGVSLQEGESSLITTKIHAQPQIDLLTQYIPTGATKLESIHENCMDYIQQAKALSALHSLVRIGLIEYEARSEGIVIARATPTSVDLTNVWISTTSSYCLAPHTQIIFKDSVSWIENPVSKWKIGVFEKMAEIIEFLQSRNEMASRSSLNGVSNLDKHLLEFFVLTGILIPSAESELLSSWETHDIFFHFKSRCRNDTAVRGASFPMHLSTPPPETFLPDRAKLLPVIPTPKSKNSPVHGFSDVLENRRSSHKKNELLDLAMLLRVSIEAFAVKERRDAMPYSYQLRSFPSAGGLHELEVFCAVDGRVTQEGSLLLFFHPIELSFYAIPASDDVVSRLLDDARQCWGSQQKPQALFIFASRYKRLAWKYEAMAYRSTLLNAGCAMQTLALVCTALGLQGCPVGNGNSELFAKAIGMSELNIASVAEFALG